jgi:hypothetical protein
MNRYIRAAATAFLVTGGLGSVGCHHTDKGGMDGHRWRNAVDPAWPERYNYAARESVLAPFAQQVANGHFMEQTLWNWYFEPGSDRLTSAGIEKLESLARHSNDTKIYLQTANDLPLTPDNADRIVQLRDELTMRRAASAQKFLTSHLGAPTNYEFAVHNAPTAGIYSAFPVNAFRNVRLGYTGQIGIQQAGTGAQTVSSGATLGGGASGGNLGAAAGAGGGTAPTPGGN